MDHKPSYQLVKTRSLKHALSLIDATKSLYPGGIMEMYDFSSTSNSPETLLDPITSSSRSHYAGGAYFAGKRHDYFTMDKDGNAGISACYYEYEDDDKGLFLLVEPNENLDRTLEVQRKINDNIFSQFNLKRELTIMLKKLHHTGKQCNYSRILRKLNEKRIWNGPAVDYCVVITLPKINMTIEITEITIEPGEEHVVTYAPVLLKVKVYDGRTGFRDYSYISSLFRDLRLSINDFEGGSVEIIKHLVIQNKITIR